MPVSLLQFAQQSNVITGGSNTTSVPFVAASSLKVVGAATLSNATLLYGAMTACNTATFTSNVTVLGALNAVTVNYSNVTVYQSEEIRSNLLVDGSATLCNGLLSIGAATLSNGLTVSGALTAAGAANLYGAATLSNTAVLANTLLVAGAATVSNALTVSGALRAAGTAAVFGAATFSNDVSTTGTTRLGNQYSYSMTFNQPTSNDTTNGSNFAQPLCTISNAAWGTPLTVRITGAANSSMTSLLAVVPANFALSSSAWTKVAPLAHVNHSTSAFLPRLLIQKTANQDLMLALAREGGTEVSTTPAMFLTVDAPSTGFRPALSFANNSAQGAIAFDTASYNALGYWTENACLGERFTARSSNTVATLGSVGVGTLAPAYRLDVAGDVRASSSVTVSSGGAGQLLQGSNEIKFIGTRHFSLFNSNYNLLFCDTSANTALGATPSATLMAINNAGVAMGGGTAAAYPLDVTGTVRVNAANATNNKLMVLYDPNSADSVASACNFYGLGMNTNALRYQVPAGGQHRFYTGCNAGMTLSNSMLRVPAILTVGGNTQVLDAGSWWRDVPAAATYWPLLQYSVDSNSPAGVMGTLKLNIGFSPGMSQLGTYVESIISRSNSALNLGYGYSNTYVSTTMWGPPNATWDLVPYQDTYVTTVFLCLTNQGAQGNGLALGGSIVAGGYSCSAVFTGTYTTTTPSGTAKPSLLTNAVRPATTLTY